MIPVCEEASLSKSLSLPADSWSKLRSDLKVNLSSFPLREQREREGRDKG